MTTQEAVNGDEPATTRWPLTQALAVRFVAVFLLLNVPFFLWLLPYGATVGEAIVARLDGPITWFGESVLGFSEVARRETGSGDTAYDWSRTVLWGVLALVVAGVWTAIARRRQERTLLAWVYIFLRYGLALAMLQYGLVKVLPSQFPEPQGDALLIPLGDMSPMGLLWRYMGFSHAFNIVTGGVEIVGGVLLLFRRTWLAGALVSAIAMVQVVAINFAFDVPVKIFSSQLLIAAIVLLVPFRHRLAVALFTDRALPQRATMQPAIPARVRRFKSPLKVAVVVLCVGFMINGAWQGYNEWGRGADFELAGIYDVQSSTETDRTPTTVVSIDHLKGMSFWHEVGDSSTMQRYQVELEDGLLMVSNFGTPAGRLRVTRPSPNTMVLTGRVDSSDISLTLRQRPAPELLSRGFHWVAEYPYSR